MPRITTSTLAALPASQFSDTDDLALDASAQDDDSDLVAAEGHTVEPPLPPARTRKPRQRKPVRELTVPTMEAPVKPLVGVEPLSTLEVMALGELVCGAVNAGLPVEEYAEQVCEQAAVWTRVQADKARRHG